MFPIAINTEGMNDLVKGKGGLMLEVPVTGGKHSSRYGSYCYSTEGMNDLVKGKEGLMLEATVTVGKHSSRYGSYCYSY